MSTIVSLICSGDNARQSFTTPKNSATQRLTRKDFMNWNQFWISCLRWIKDLSFQERTDGVFNIDDALSSLALKDAIEINGKLHPLHPMLVAQMLVGDRNQVVKETWLNRKWRKSRPEEECSTFSWRRSIRSRRGKHDRGWSRRCWIVSQQCNHQTPESLRHS